MRQYFDALLPTDPVELAVMYCHGWHTDFHDPDLTYQKEEQSGHRFDYPVRKSVKIAEMIARDPSEVARAVEAFAVGEAKSSGPFARRLADLSPDPLALFNMALKVAEELSAKPNLPFFGGLISSVDARDPKDRPGVRSGSIELAEAETLRHRHD